MAEEQVCSPSMRKYFQEIETEVTRSYKLANQARALNLDPEDHVDIIRTQNMAERVAGLISIVAPQLLHTNLAERIPELEKEYGKLDWRVGFKVAEEVAKESFCKFSSKEEAMEVAIRVGFAYLTLGIVSAPLEGFVCLKIKKRLDNGQPYFSLNYAGPVRGAGGTAAATSVLLSDYVRVKMGYAEYDPTEEEVKRFATEIHDYHERVTNLQYHPSTEEIEFLARHVPVEINGDPTEKFEVSQHKDIPRIETNRIRGGVCLVMAEGIAQKAPKLWKRLSVWGKEMGLNWEFLAEFLEMQKQIKAKQEVKKEAKSEEKLTPNFTFIKDLVAGRPILTYPMREGGFRLRYGRSRLSGFSALGLNPATMQILDKFIAIGTQLKIERPGKAGVVSLCDTIDGPIVKLKNGSVVYLATPAEAKIVNDSVEEILFLGDILFNYGDFSENGHKLIPAGYCPEWWIQEVEKAAKEKFSEERWFNLSSQIGIAENRLKELKENFLTVFPSVEESGRLSSFLNVPLHPAYTYHWRRLSLERLKQLFVWLKQATFEYQDETVKKIILPWKKEDWAAAKESLELIGMPHKVSIEFIVLENEAAQTISLLFNFKTILELEKIVLSETAVNALEAINTISLIKMRDKSGTFIGARMGRPEKAKMRKMDGSPQALFPVGEEGDRMRSFQSALAAGKVTADFPLLYCQKCKKNTIYLCCEICGEKPLQKYHCKFCGDLSKEQCQHGPARNFGKITIDIKHYFDLAMKQTEIKMAPDLIKGVRGTSNKNHFVENLAKGLLRAKHNLYVNKDGTIRYDCTEMPITHFKPIEVNTSVEKLKGLGYETDIHDKPLETTDQILELKPQDVILPGFNSLDESAIQVMFRTAKFVDELLVKIYHQPPFYNLKNEGDLIGHLVIGLAPHISAGLMGRIIGFSETQGLLAHPLWHAGLRRDCDGDEAAILMLMDGLLNFSRQFLPDQRGGRSVTSDTLVYIRREGKISTLEIGNLISELFSRYGFVNEEGYKILRDCPEKIETLSFDTLGRVNFSSISSFISHQNDRRIFRIKTTNGELRVTEDHSIFITRGKDIQSIPVRELLPGQAIVGLHYLKLEQKQSLEIDVLRLLDPSLAYITLDKMFLKKIKTKLLTKKIFQLFGKNNPYRYLSGTRAAPYKFYQCLTVEPEGKIRLKADSAEIERKIPLNKQFYKLLGFIMAEGAVSSQRIELTNTSKEIMNEMAEICNGLFGYRPSLRIDRRSEKYASGRCFKLSLPRIFALSLIAYGLNTNKARQKEIPSFVFEAPPEKIKAFLEGYLLRDGSVRKGCSLLYTSSSKLAAGLSLLLSLAGYKSGLHKTKTNKYQISYSFINNTDPFWPLWEFAKELSTELRKNGVAQEEIKLILADVRKNKRMKTTSLGGIKNILSLLPPGETKRRLQEIAAGHLKVERVVKVEQIDYAGEVYDFAVPGKENFLCGPHPIFAHNTMDAPLVLTSIINPSEVDDQAQGIDVVWKYPLEFYEAALQYKPTSEVKIAQIKHSIGKETQFEKMGFIHQTNNLNAGINCSSYKTIPEMMEKLRGQMELARRIRAVDTMDVANMVIQKHFLKDIRGNLRQFSQQQFRCTKCNTKYRRPPLLGRCSCGQNLIFTVTEGSIVKYLGPSMMLAKDYGLSDYLKQNLELTHRYVESIFGKEKDKQEGLVKWFGG